MSSSIYSHPSLSTLAHAVRAILGFARPAEYRRLWLTVAVVALAALVSAGTPVLLALLLENIQQASGFSATTIMALMAAFVVTKALGRIMGALDTTLYAPLGETLVWRVGMRLVEAAAARRVSSRERDDMGALGALQDRMMRASRGVFSVLYVVVLRLLPIVIEIVVVGTVLGSVMGWHAPVIIAAGGGLYWYFVSMGRGREAQAQREVQVASAQVARRMTETTGNARLIGEYAAQPFMTRRIQSAVDAALASNRRIVKVQLLRASTAAAGIAACYAIAMAYAWFFMRTGTLSAGAIFLLVTYVDRIISPLNSVSNYITTLRGALIAMDICEELGVFGEGQRGGERSDVVDSPSPAAPAAAGGITLRGVDGAVVSLQPGRAMLVSGPSGAGKSSLLSRIYAQAPVRGDIDGTALSMNELLDCFPVGETCYLPSQVTLLPGDVRDNILLGHEEFADDLRRSVWPGMWPPITGKVHRVELETDIGELSAGERQRIGLARALLRRPKLLILDEATNALDLASEREIWAFIRRWLPQSRLLVAAHRVDNFADAEHVVRIQEGRIIAMY